MMVLVVVGWCWVLRLMFLVGCRRLLRLLLFAIVCCCGCVLVVGLGVAVVVCCVACIGWLCLCVSLWVVV